MDEIDWEAEAAIWGEETRDWAKPGIDWKKIAVELFEVVQGWGANMNQGEWEALYAAHKERYPDHDQGQV